MQYRRQPCLGYHVHSALTHDDTLESCGIVASLQKSSQLLCGRIRQRDSAISLLRNLGIGLRKRGTAYLAASV